MKVVIILAFAAAVLAAPTTHRPPKSQISHMIETSIEMAHHDADVALDKCDICQEIVTLAEDALAMNKTETEIENSLNELCGIIASSPLKEFAPVCTEIASNIPLLVQLIESELPAAKVCQLLKMCSATAVIRVAAHGVSECEICEEVISVAESALRQNSTVEEISHLLHQVCNVMAQSPLSVFADRCNGIADKAALIVQLLEDELPPSRVCALLKFCTSNNEEVHVEKDVTIDLGVDKCDICKEVVTLAEGALQQNKTEEEITSAVNSLCTILESSPLKELAPTCHEIASNIPLLIQLLESQLPSDRICQLLGICTTTKETLAALNEHKKPAYKSDLGLDQCSICEEVVTLAEGALQQNKTEAEIENAINQLCSLIDNSPLKQFGPVCHQIASNIPLLIQLLESEVPASEICTLLKFCTSKTVKAIKPRKIHTQALDKCAVCEEIVGIAEGALQKNSTEAEIETLLNELCSAIDNSPLKQFGAMCHEVASNVPLLIQLLESEVSPTEVCTLLKICTATPVKVVNKLTARASVDKCAICEEVVSLAEGALQQNSTEAEITNLVNQLCSVIDNSPLKQFGAVCHEIASNIPLLIQLIESEVSPDQVCALLKVCPAVAPAPIKAAKPQLQGLDKCSICQEIVTLAEGFLEKNGTEAEIESAINSLCTAIDNSPLKQFGAMCHEIASNVPLLIQLIESEASPSEVCTLLKYCTSKANKVAEAKKVHATVTVDKCSICEQVVNIAEGALQQNSTVTEIETLVNQLCSVIDNSPLKEFGAVCHEVAANIPLLIQLLESEVTPEKACTLLKLCTSANTHSAKH